LTARKALRARSRIIGAFRKYFETGGHLEAFPMIPDMYAKNRGYGLAASEAAKMEMATSLAMLSSGAITAFWLIFHILSDCHALHAIRQELHAITKIESLSELAIPQTAILDLSRIKEESPTLMAMLHETLRYHSTVINIKQVQQDIVLADEYLLRRNGIVMIPGRSIHHDQDIWGSTANIFNHQRFLSPETARNLSSTSAFRPFGAGATMCPGRHFSTQVILSLVAMIVLQYDVLPVGGQWVQPTKRNAEMWNAMPKPDWDIHVQLVRRQHKGQIQLQFV
jgi:cytochrome P450